jgi:hypothetical protein
MNPAAVVLIAFVLLYLVPLVTAMLYVWRREDAEDWDPDGGRRGSGW